MEELYRNINKNVTTLNISNKLRNKPVWEKLDIKFIDNTLKIIYSDFNFKVTYEFSYYKIKFIMHAQYYSLILSILRTIGLRQYKLFQPNIDSYFEDVIYIENRKDALDIIITFINEFKKVEDTYLF